MYRFMLCIILMFSAAFSMENTDTSTTLQKILESKELVVGMHKADYPPFYFKKRISTIGDAVYGVIESNDSDDDPLVLIGQNIDLAEGLGKKLGVKVRYVREVLRFDDLVYDLMSGKTHVIISHFSDTDKRRQIIDFSDTYLSSDVCLLASPIRLKKHTDHLKLPPILYSRDFNQNFIKIIARDGSTHAETARKAFQKASVYTIFNTQYDHLMACIEKGAFDATIGDELALSIIFYRNPEGRKILQLYPLYPEDYEALGLTAKRDNIAIGIQKGSAELKNIINEYLKTVSFTPESIINDYVIGLGY